jgi:hypothetical protein
MAFRNGKATCTLCDTGSSPGPSPVDRRVVHATVTVATPADTDVSLGDGNIDTALGDLSGGVFVTDYDIYLNGARQINGASSASNKDVYPGTSLAAGQLRFEKKVKVGDIIAVVDWVE